MTAFLFNTNFAKHFALSDKFSIFLKPHILAKYCILINLQIKYGLDYYYLILKITSKFSLF